MATPFWTPSFTLSELYEISDAVLPLLRDCLFALECQSAI